MPLTVLPQDNQEERPWYRDGLRFKCTECGRCCTGSPGYVWVTPEDVAKIAAHLNLPIDKFSRKYLRNVMGKMALLENSKNYDCVFLRDKKCLVYPVRPKQCRTFPWWVHNLRSREGWEAAAADCEGINNEAPLVPYEVIQEQLVIGEDDQ